MVCRRLLHIDILETSISLHVKDACVVVDRSITMELISSINSVIEAFIAVRGADFLKKFLAKREKENKLLQKGKKTQLSYINTVVPENSFLDVNIKNFKVGLRRKDHDFVTAMLSDISSLISVSQERTTIKVRYAFLWLIE